jgi:hypothetical protein
MNARPLAFAALLLFGAAPATPVKGSVAVPIDFFYSTLAPYGDWIFVDGYGYCWQPSAALAQTGWHPYTEGYWAWTDAGWTWISFEPFGWATYHYGRWMMMSSRWCWVPGVEWAPAWVSWRQTGHHIGWAPLPPDACWSPRVGFSTWTDAHFGIGPGFYNFVPVNAFCRPAAMTQFVLPRTQNVTVFNQSVNVTQIRHQQNVVNNIFVGGPDVGQIERYAGAQVPRYHLRRDADTFRRDWLDGSPGITPNLSSISRLDRNQLVVAAPAIDSDRPPILPHRVRESVGRPEIDRGWRMVGSDATARAMQQQLRDREARGLPSALPERRPVIATSTRPPPALGRVLNATERGADRGIGGRPIAGIGGGGAPAEEAGSSTTIPGSSTAGRPSPGGGSPSIPGRPGSPFSPPSGFGRGSTPQTGPSASDPSSEQPVLPPSRARPSTPSAGSLSVARPGGPSLPSISRPSVQPSSVGSQRTSPPSVSRPSTTMPSRPSAPSVGRPGTSPPSVSRPSTSMPSRPSAPSVSRPGVPTPSVSRPGTPPTSAGRPGTSPPSVSRPSTSMPGRPSAPSVSRPGTSPPSVSRPSTSMPSRPSNPSVSRPSTTMPSRPSAPSVSRPSVRPPSVSRPATPSPSARPSTPAPSYQRPSAPSAGGLQGSPSSRSRGR